MAALTAHVQAFAQLRTERRGRDLEAWMPVVTADDQRVLQSFATGLRCDQDTGSAGLTFRWNSGVAGGRATSV